MAFERIELNICPAGDMPVFHCSQYDVGRPIIIDLKNGDDAFTPSAGTTFELHCRKVDDNIVTLDTYEVDGNTLTFTSTEQLCACPGDNLCEVAIYLDELCMGTLNFMLHVEPDPLAGGLESETQIYNLTEQVEDITEQVIGNDYYDKTEVDDLLDTKADAATTYTKTEVDTALNLKADKSTTYTKTETNNLLAGKADASDTYSKAQVDSKLSLKADKATTYTKTETDTLLGYKANASQVYTMSQTDLLLADKADKSTTYTKTQVDDALALKANSVDLATVATTGDYDDLLNKPNIEGMIADALLEVMPVDTASGPIATFDTELDAPLVNVSCDVVATGGNGTPDNPNPIVGYSSANITRCGVNLFDVEQMLTDNNVSYTKDGDWVIFEPITALYVNHFKLSGTSNKSLLLLIDSGSTATNIRVRIYDHNNSFIVSTPMGNPSSAILENRDISYISFDWTNVGNIKIKVIVVDDTRAPTAYEPYNGQTYAIAFGQTVYGGVLDVTRGKLHVTHKIVDLGDLGWVTENDTQTGLCRASAQFTDCVWQSVMICSAYNYNPTTSYIGLSNGDIALTNSESIPLLRIRNTDYSTYTNAQIKEAVTGMKLVYQTKTPFDIDLTPVQINAIIGTNNMYSDTNGDTTVQFKDSIQHYIDTKVGS